MVAKIVTTVVTGLVVFLCVGCSFDTMSIIDHPARVNEGQQFEVALYNQFLHITNGGTITMDIIRDSLHVAVGAPSGWTIESARFYVARDWDIVSLASQLDDTVALALAIYDSSFVFKSRATAMTADPGFSAALAGRSYQVADRNDDNTIIVETDAIDSWSCFRGYTNILYTEGTPVDTLTVDSTGDTTGFSVMPVFAWVTLRAPSNARQDTLVYYSKTAAMPPLDDTGNIDIGEMSYAAIAVGDVPVLSRSVAPRSRIKIRAPSGGQNVTIDLGPMMHDISSLGIYSLSGSLIADLTPRLGLTNGVITWDGSGKTVRTGMYLLRCRTKEGVVTQAFQMVR